MIDTPSLPDYEDITNVLDQGKSTFGAAQVHGLFCGLVCATSGAEINAGWQELLFPAKAQPISLESLEQLYEISYHLLSEFSFEFDLLLPNSSVDINTRTEALGLWCQGFLAGLQQGGVPLIRRSPSEVTDAINDLVEIAQVSFGDIADNDDDETAYFELVEYVRLSVLMIFQDLKTDKQDSQRNQEDSLH